MASEEEVVEEAISVSVRVRPLNSKEQKHNCESIWRAVGGNSIYSAPEGQTYTFDNVFSDATTTRQVYDCVARDLVRSVLRGMNGTVFAYGQTASGKTYTMQGEPKSPGMLGLAAEQIFEEIEAQTHCQFLLKVSYIEIYNEQVKDLLSDSDTNLRIREDRDKGFFVDNLQMKTITCADDIVQIKEEGERRRHVGETNMNMRSSRSHTIFSLRIEVRDLRSKDEDDEDDVEQVDEDVQDDKENNNNNNKSKESKSPSGKRRRLSNEDTHFGVLVGNLNLVDLAGSENARSTGAEGGRLKEGGNINKSLLTLSRVISQLASSKGKVGFINWRDSKLTQILQPSLAGNCRTAIVCCITPANRYFEETKSTLSFASRAKQIRTRAIVNEVLDGEGEMRKLKRTIHALRMELASQQEINAEKTALEMKIQSLKALLLKGGTRIESPRGTTAIDIADDLATTDVPVSSASEGAGPAKRRRKNRETWCPGDFKALKESQPTETTAAYEGKRDSLDSSTALDTSVNTIQSASSALSEEEPVFASERIQALQFKVASKTKELQELEEKFDALQSEFDMALEKEKEARAEAVQAHEEELANITNTLKDAERNFTSKILSLESELEQVRGEMAASEAQFKESKEKIRDLLEARTTECADLKENVAQLKEQLEQKEKETEALQKELERIQQDQSTRFDSVADEHKSLQEKLEAQETSLSNLTEANKELVAELEAKRNECSALEEKLASLSNADDTKFNAHIATHQQLEALISELGEEKTELTAKIAQLEDVLVQAEMDKEEKVSEAEATRAELAVLEDKVKEINKMVAESAGSEQVSSVDDCMGLLKAVLVKQGASSSEELERLKESFEQEKASLQASLEQVQQQHESVVQELSEQLAEAKALAAETEAALETFKQEAKEESQARQQVLQEKCDALESALQDQSHTEELTALKAQVESLQEELDVRAAQLEKKQAELDEALAKDEEEDVMQGETLEEQLQDKVADLRALEQTVDDLRAELLEARQAQQQGETMVSELNAKISELSALLEQAKQSQKDDVNVVQLEQELCTSRETLECLQQQMNRAEAVLKENQQAMEEYAVEKTHMMSSIAEKDDQILALQQEIAQLFDQVQREQVESCVHALVGSVEVALLEDELNHKIEANDDVCVDSEQDSEAVEVWKKRVSQLESHTSLVQQEMEHKTAQWRQDLDEAIEALHSAEEEKSRLQTQVDELERSLERSKCELDNTSSAKESLRNENDSLQNKLQQLMSDFQTSARLNVQGMEDSETLQSTSKHAAQLQLRLDLAIQEREKALARIAELETERKAMEVSAYGDIEEWKAQVKSKEEELFKMSSEKARLGSMLEAVREELVQVKAKLVSVEQEWAVKMSSTVEEYEAKLTQTGSEAESGISNEQAERLKTSVLALERKCESLKDQIAERDERIDRMQESIDALNEELAQASKDAAGVEDKEHLLAQIETLEEKLSQSASKMSSAASEVEEMRTRLGRQKESMESMDEERSRLQALVEELQEKVEANEEELKELVSLRQVVETKEEIIEELDANIKALNNQVKAQEEASEGQVEELTNVHLALTEANSRIAELEKELSSSSATLVDELREKVAHLEQSLEKSQERIRKLEMVKMTQEHAQKFKNQKEEIRQLKIQLAEVSASNDTLVDSQQNLRARVSALQSELTAQNDQLTGLVRSKARRFGILDNVTPAEFITMLSKRLSIVQEERDSFESQVRVLEIKDDDEGEELARAMEMLNTYKAKLRESEMARARVESEMAKTHHSMSSKRQADSEEVATLREESARLRARLREFEEDFLRSKEEGEKNMEKLVAQLDEQKNTIRFLENENLNLMVSLRKGRERSSAAPSVPTMVPSNKTATPSQRDPLSGIKSSALNTAGRKSRSVSTCSAEPPLSEASKEAMKPTAAAATAAKGRSTVDKENLQQAKAHALNDNTAECAQQ